MQWKVLVIGFGPSQPSLAQVVSTGLNGNYYFFLKRKTKQNKTSSHFHNGAHSKAGMASCCMNVSGQNTAVISLSGYSKKLICEYIC